MNPAQLDADGILNGKRVHAGDVIGKVGNYNNAERGTTYHLHFDMQVPTKAGWVFVNPYMTLVSAYERLIQARGTEIKDGDPTPEVAGVPPVILHPSESSAEAVVPAPRMEESTVLRVKAHPDIKKPHKKHRHGRKRHKRGGN
jgi:murein DD-endopeptidase MepM/ murein hydrolase activator NlpD